jgi:phospholipid N-methyltransferase
MNQKLKTSIAYIKNIFITGAITQSSRNVEVEICKYVPKQDYKTIVEFGMGHGNITSEILRIMSSNSKLYAFEVNKSFCEHVRNTITDDRLIIINDSAENIKEHIKEDLDLIISSIPLSFFSKEKGLGIIQDTYDKLVDNAYYSQFLYSKNSFKKFKQIFEQCYIEIIKNNIPTTYIYHCKKVKKTPLTK